MKTNFFEHIAGLPFNGNLNLTIAKQGNGELAVSVFLANDKLSDKAGQAIPPMLFKGIATELDEGFFEAIATPIKSTARLFANMDDYQKGLDNARLNAKQEQDKKNKSAKGKGEIPTADNDDNDETDEVEDLFSAQQNEQRRITEKKEAYDNAMKKIAELNGQCKYDEAITLLPAVADYPEKEEEITRKSSDLRKRKEMLDALKNQEI